VIGALGTCATAGSTNVASTKIPNRFESIDPPVLLWDPIFHPGIAPVYIQRGVFPSVRVAKVVE
jgi:hypothetical protein